MRTLLQKLFVLTALLFICIPPVLAMTLAEAKTACKKANGNLVVTKIAIGSRYACLVGEKEAFSGTATPQAAPTPSQAAPTPVVPKTDLIKAPTAVTPAPPAVKAPTTVPAQVKAVSSNAALAQEMKNAGRDAKAVATALKARGASAPETAQILKKVFNLTDAGANATVLKAAGFSGQQIGDALKKVFGLSAAMVGNHLKALGNSQTGDTDMDRRGTIVTPDFCTIVPLKVSGILGFSNCTPSANAINVKISRRSCVTNLPSTITVNPVRGGDGIYRYSVDQPGAVGSYTIEAEIADSSSCSVGGIWQADSNYGQPTSNFRLSATGATPAIHHFTYIAPTARVLVPARRMADYLWVAFSVNGTLKIRFNNVANGSYKANDAYIEYAVWSGTRFEPRRKYITIPEVRFDLDAGGSGIADYLTPDLGDALFYVNDINLESIAVRDGFILTYVFEERGPEIKGYFTSDVTGRSDAGMPDADVTNMELVARITLAPVDDLLGYKEVVLPMFKGTAVVCPGICNRALDAIFGYNSILRKTVSEEFGKALNENRQDFSIGFTALFNPASPLSPIDRAHRFRGRVTSVGYENGNIVIYYVRR